MKLTAQITRIVIVAVGAGTCLQAALADGMQMPLAGMSPSGYTGCPQCPNLQNLTYSTAWTGNYDCGCEGSGTHSGVDIPVLTGTSVVAVADGTVITASTGYNSGWGNLVVISHNIPNVGTIYSCYAHLSQVIAVAGPVNKGQEIGKSGSTGNSTGPHLHFQIDQSNASYHPYFSSTSSTIDDIRQHTYSPIYFIKDHAVVDSCPGLDLNNLWVQVGGTGCGASDNPLGSVFDALAKPPNDGGTIHIKAGSYTQIGTLNPNSKTVHLVAEGGNVSLGQ